MTQQLVRSTALFGAVILGLGSIVGTGAFVSIGFGYALAGEWLLYAILLAAFVALCNGLSSAQLAAVHPVSGGTYEYGYKFLNHDLGFVAGWFFIAAKSASAAAAALASAWLMNQYLGWPEWAVTSIAIGFIVFLTALVLAGLRRSNQVNALLVGLAIASLIVFVVWSAQAPRPAAFVRDSAEFSLRDFLAAAGLLFVAYTGYGRIATMGEEVQEPRRVIPRAIIATMVVVTVLYGAVAWALMQRNPLFIGEDFILTQLMAPGLARDFVFIGAILAMLGVTLNLILGVSRVVLAMARRGDLPHAWATLNSTRTSAPTATWVTAAVMIAIAALGGIRLAWTFSAFTVLIYYSITNLAALKVQREQRFIAKTWPLLGLVGCVSLAVMLHVGTVFIGLVLLILGLAWHRYRYRALRN
ncbi:amino acid transporter [Pseudidiomarina aquimaris]|uniref:Amino acid transporter n=1 Tax=Pseudidiomarina aquimaris TaxID=641841 RepID=A0A432XI10_9GAMM|nr:APC family permease [Pseudidiomarina aquimaris]RUO48227.1 amino acid transporter [Pseudidiomarina aquimaris]|tara:strand:+ start:2290 stop:3531 length:1242 start_codon:yes stop_codon:yes gene_type:complete